MSYDIADLDLLPETDPAPVADLAGLGAQRCSWTCWFWTCLNTCSVTDS